jgi:hypothetical protein
MAETKSLDVEPDSEDDLVFIKIKEFQDDPSPKILSMPKRVVRLSSLMQTTLDGTGEKIIEFTLKGTYMASFSTQALDKMVGYLLHHDGQAVAQLPMPLQANTMSQVCPDPWDADFIDTLARSRKLLFAVIHVANYFGVNGLLELGCAKVALILKDKNQDEMKAALDNDEP